MEKIQILKNGHKEKLYEHYAELDAEARGYRFGITISDIALKHFVNRINIEDITHFGIFDNGKLIAVCQLSKTGDATPDTYELGISVHQEYRRHGLGNKLWEATVKYATEQNVREIQLQHATHNRPMSIFCRNKGMSITNVYGERVGVWENPNYTPNMQENFNI